MRVELRMYLGGVSFLILIRASYSKDTDAWYLFRNISRYSIHMKHVYNVCLAFYGAIKYSTEKLLLINTSGKSNKVSFSLRQDQTQCTVNVHWWWLKMTISPCTCHARRGNNKPSAVKIVVVFASHWKLDNSTRCGQFLQARTFCRMYVNIIDYYIL